MVIGSRLFGCIPSRRASSFFGMIAGPAQHGP
jgi:hypothetical protein